MREPHVLAAFNPVDGSRSFSHNGWHGFVVLGSVFLVVTGGEALYADMGHFGRRPDSPGVVCARPAGAPAQLPRAGRDVLLDPASCVVTVLPDGAALGDCYPLVVLATMAAVIASQALISGAFSLTRQAIQLGYSPAPRHRAHVRDPSGPDLRAPGELGVDDRYARPRAGIPSSSAPGRRIRHRRHV